MVTKKGGRKGARKGTRKASRKASAARRGATRKRGTVTRARRGVTSTGRRTTGAGTAEAADRNLRAFVKAGIITGASVRSISPAQRRIIASLRASEVATIVRVAKRVGRIGACFI